MVSFLRVVLACPIHILRSLFSCPVARNEALRKANIRSRKRQGNGIKELRSAYISEHQEPSDESSRRNGTKRRNLCSSGIRIDNLKLPPIEIMKGLQPAGVIVLAVLVFLDTLNAFTPSSHYGLSLLSSRPSTTRERPLCSFFGDFEKFDNDEDEEDDDEDDDDEYDDLDEKSIADFRSKMGNMFGDTPPTTEEGSGISSVDELISFARSQSGVKEQPVVEWAKPSDAVKPGTILVANPDKFCSTGTGILASGPSPSLLAKFGLTRPPPKDLGPDRQADLLPVLVLVDKDDKRGCRGVLLNRRTGYLLGDLEQPPAGLSEPAATPPILEKFCIQPLWFGGIDNISSGLDMLHLCPTVQDAQKLTEDGLFWGGDPAQAQEAMEDPSLDRVMTGFDFKFFVQSTIWSTKDLEREIKEGIWFPASVSKEVLFKSRDRMGTQKAKPLWTEIMELMGGEYQQIKNKFYNEDS